MVCPTCSANVADSAKFCSQCGGKLASACPSCQAPTQPGQKFCAQCGGSLEHGQGVAAPAGGERKAITAKLDGPSGDRRVVTVLFTDVSGFTAMSEKLDPEQVTEIVNNFFSVLVEPIYRYGGVVDKYIGDAIMALFGAPVAHEDDPLRAVRAAWEMQIAAKRHAAELEATTGIALKVRIGLNTGLVVAGSVGGSQRSDYTVMGDTVNLAQRMEANAQPGKVLVTAETWMMTRQAFDYTTLAPITVKGKAEAVAVYELAGTRSPMAEPADDVLVVGRDAQLERLDAAWHLVESGRPQWVTVVGDMGLGKSAFTRRFLKGLKTQAQVLWGRALSYDRQPYLVAANLLLYRLGLPHQAPVREILDQLETLVRDLLPEDPDRSVALLAYLLGLDVAHVEVGSLSPKHRRTAAFLALDDLLAALASRGPLVLSLEDLHWADEASLEWIAQLADRLTQPPALPILLLCQSRPDSPFLSLSLDDRIDRTSIAMQPLSPAESLALAAALLGATPDGLAPPVRAVLDQVLSRAEGNPFYLAELVRSLQEGGILIRRGATWGVERPAGEFRLPTNVQGAIAARLDRLEANQKRLLQVAAVIGRTFEPAVLEKSVGADVQGGLAELARSGFLYRRSTGEAAFTQAIIQEVAYQNLLLSARRDLHRRVGAVLEEAAGSDLASAARVLAYHFVRGEVPDKACRFLFMSADQYHASYAVAEALTTYRQALEWHQKAGETVPGVDRAALLAGLASVEITTGDLTAALEHLEESLHLGPVDAVAAECHRLILKALIRKGDDRAALGRCTARLADLAQVSSAGSSLVAENIRAERAVLLTTQAEMQQRLGEFEAAAESCRQALELLKGSERLAEMAGAYNVLGTGAYLRRDFAEAIEHYQRTVALRERIKDAPGIAGTLNNLALAYAGQGQWAVAADAYDRALKMYSRIGDVAMVANIQVNLGALLLSMGRVEEADRAFCTSDAIYTKLGNPLGQASAASFLGQLAIATGRGAEAASQLSRSFTLLEQVGARAYAAEVLRCWGHAEVLAGRLDQARDILEQGRVLAREAHNDQESAIIETLRAELLSLDGDAAGGARAVNDAIDKLRQVSDPLELGRALLRAARIHRAAGDPGSASRANEEAATLFSRLGAALDLAAAQALTGVSCP